MTRKYGADTEIHSGMSMLGSTNVTIGLDSIVKDGVHLDESHTHTASGLPQKLV